MSSFEINDNNLSNVHDSNLVRSTVRGRRRGRVSRQKHQDSYRLRKGADTMKKIQAEVRDETFSSLDSLISMLNEMNISRSTRCSRVPLSTRGFGFLVDAIWDSILQEFPKIIERTGFTKFAFYRITLCQLAIQQSIAERFYGRVYDSDPVDAFIAQPIPGLLEKVERTRMAFRPIAAVVNGVGSFDYQSKQYCSFFPQPLIQAACHAETTTIVASTSSGVKRAASALTFPERSPPPNPYFVNIYRLYEATQYLSDPASDLGYRRWFRNYNPIPGARWNDSCVLLNAADIMPVNFDAYAAGWLESDVAKYCSMLNGVGLRFPLSELRFDGKGNAGQHVYSKWDHGSAINIDNYLQFSDIKFRSVSIMKESQLLYGAIGFYELPRSFGDYDPYDPACGFGIRDPAQSANDITIDWVSLARKLLYRPT